MGINPANHGHNPANHGHNPANHGHNPANRGHKPRQSRAQTPPPAGTNPATRRTPATPGNNPQPTSPLSLLLPPPGAHRLRLHLTQGVASLRSLALGWELVAPSGRALNAWKNPGCPPGRALNAGCLRGGRRQVVGGRAQVFITHLNVCENTNRVFAPTNPGFEKTNPGFGNSIAAIENPKPGFVWAVGGIGGVGPTGRAWSRRGLGSVGPLRCGGCPGS